MGLLGSALSSSTAFPSCTKRSTPL
jgi:hypothetical protein